VTTRWVCVTLLIALAAALPMAAQVSITPGLEKIEVVINGAPFTTFYVAGDDVRKPYLHPLRAASGTYVTRMWPMEKVAEEADAANDHPHHRGLWFAHDPVSGVNFWASESIATPDTRGIIVLRELGDIESGVDRGSIAATFEWRDPGGAPMVVERRLMVFHADDPLRTIDFDITLTAVRDVEFADSKEGTFGLRVRPVMEEDGGSGQIVNADGLVGEQQAWGKPSKWCDYSGTINGEELGIAILDHPDNPNHPVRWHVRGYGLFAANPFGLDAFTGETTGNGGVRLRAGESRRFRYRVVVHPDDAASANIDRLWMEYASGN